MPQASAYSRVSPEAGFRIVSRKPGVLESFRLQNQYNYRMPYVDPEKRRLYKQKWNKDFYKKNKQAEIRRVAKRKQKLRDWLDELKKGLKCEMCEENHPACLDFHHPNSKEKDFSVGSIKGYGWSQEWVLNEIQKCMVVCANCHRKLHASMAKVE